MRKSPKILLALLSITSLASAVDIVLTKECAKKYLKDRGFEEELLDHIRQFTGSSIKCDAIVEHHIGVFYKVLEDRLNDSRATYPFKECVLADVKDEDENYGILMLRETSIDMISNLRFWSYFSKSSRLSELRSKIDDLVEKSILRCRGHRVYTNLFDDIHENVTVWKRNGEQEYCMREYLVAKQLINPRSFNFQLNPKKVPTDNLDCSEILASHKEKLIEDAKNSENLSNCEARIYSENGYEDYVMKVEVLAKCGLDKFDYSKEKQDFINALVAITYKSAKC